MTAALLEVRGLRKHYALAGHGAARTVKAVDGVSFEVQAGRTLALVGESGCGKTTTGKSALRLIEPTAGEILYGGVDLARLSQRDLRERRRELQFVFQDPYASLNPKLSAGAAVAEPLDNFSIGTRAERRERVAQLFERVGLHPEAARKYPHEFSGGQRQRLGIARALALGPKLIVCDEPVSALDVSVQAQVVNLLMDLQEQLGIAYLFVAHDLAVVRHISHRVAVMYLGRIVELADRDALFAQPTHPYTEVLLSAIPQPDPALRRPRIALVGEPPSASNPPPGCKFHTRCPLAQARCRVEEPELTPRPDGRQVACHLR
jgi:oligopeptide/dipeptide ABC transporter ATP-binding protein